MLKKAYPSLIVIGTIKNDTELEKFISLNAKRGYYSEREQNIGTWRPYGLLWKYYPDNLSASSDSASLLANNRRFWERMYKIPSLSKYERNIFHLNSVEEYYLNAYQNYAKLLVFMGKYEEAEVVLKNIMQRYGKGDVENKIIYMNILVYEKKCLEASRIASEINLDSTVKTNPGFIKPALSFLQTCDSQNAKIPEYTKLLLEYDKGSKTNLNSF